MNINRNLFVIAYNLGYLNSCLISYSLDEESPNMKEDISRAMDTIENCIRKIFNEDWSIDRSSIVGFCGQVQTYFMLKEHIYPYFSMGIIASALESDAEKEMIAPLVKNLVLPISIELIKSVDEFMTFLFSIRDMDSNEIMEEIYSYLINDFLIEDGTLLRYTGKDSHVVIPDTVTRVAKSVFADCTSVKSVTISKTIIDIHPLAFSGSKHLTELYYEGGIEDWLNISHKTAPGESCVLTNSYNLYINNELVTNIVIPNDIIKIDDYAFSHIRSLTSVNMHDSVISIGANAFSGCGSLATISISQSVTDIKSGAFYGCKSLTSVVIPDSVVNIGNFAFSGCSSLERVIMSEDIPRNISRFAFVGARKRQKGYVFISYSTRNQDYAEAALHLLENEHIGTWMAPYDIPAGSKYAHVINKAIKDCSCVLLLLSGESQESEWVDKEIERAVSYKKSIIAMHLDESQLNDGFSFYLGNQQIIPVKDIDKNNVNVQKVLNAIKSFLI